MLYTTHRDLYTSKTASEVTSEIAWVGDASSVNLFLDSASVMTLQGHNGNGRDAALDANHWSTLTALTPTNAMLDVAVGFRWLRVLRGASSASAQLALTQGG